MKKYTFLAILSIFMLSFSAFAEESALIDFSTLVDNYQGQNQETILDFSKVAGTRYTEAEKAEMVTSLYIPNWEVRLSSSSRSIENDSMSLVKAVNVNESAASFANEQVMGIRVHFPTGNFNSYAFVKPPFQIPAYATSPVVEDAERGEQFTGYGVVKNVGVIKQVKVWVYGMNYPMGLYIVLRDENEVKNMYFMGYIDHEGWEEKIWNNPNYITDVRNRVIMRDPLYPRSAPSVTLDSIVVYRDAMQEGGEFITYIKDIKVVYDLAIIGGVDKDIKHEEVWGILETREEQRRNFELERLGDQQVLRYLEKSKMHQDSDIPSDSTATTTTPADTTTP
jgi:hypothetical protein